MATYLPTTTSNAPALSEPTTVQEILNLWHFIPCHGSLTVAVDNGTLNIYGEADFEPYPESATPTDDPQPHVDQEQFLSQIAPYLEEDLVIQNIGREKQRFPLRGSLYMVDSETQDVQIDHFHDRITDFLDEAPY